MVEVYPDRYGIGNNTAESGLKLLEIIYAWIYGLEGVKGRGISLMQYRVSARWWMGTWC